MDIGIDTIVYIVLGIIFVVAQAARKKKPQSAPGDYGNDNEDSVPGSSKGFLEQFLDLEEERKPEWPVYQEEAPPPEESAPMSSNEFDAKIISQSEVNEIGKEVMAYEYNENIIADQKERSKKDRAFDLRKAVIYSAILERKYF